MCQLIPCITRYTWNRHIIISRCRCEQDLLCIRIHRHNNIYITSTVRCNRTSHINTADKHIEWFRHVSFLLTFYLRLNSILIQNLDLLREPLDRLINHTHIAFIEHCRIYFSIQQCLCLIRQRTIFFRFYIFSNFRFNFLDHLISILLIHRRLITKPVIHGIFDVLRRITFLHDHDHVIRLVGGSADFLKYIIGLHHSHADRRQYDGHQETDDHTRIAQHLILRILQDMCRTKEYCQCPDQEDQVLLRQHPTACHSHDQIFKIY